ncbi:Chloride channel protein-related protein [Bergeriella denitrificans]|uniref:Chloride channel protein-related protein n=2 Tax=Bergeriella denitrificans TaxID=494 RepID=A0A378UKQ6_BERDE|nr:Chloride channel protein-related protein [Bergeriella denitrificans]
MVGIGAGIAGITLTHLLHFVQHHAFGYALNGETVPFRVGVEEASGTRRFVVLLLCGLLAGGGWYLLKRFGRPLVSLKTSLGQPTQGLPFKETMCHVFLQIATVGMGSPLGRETAPREMSAALASLWIRRRGIGADDAKLLLACASGAGLAAVYNAPLAGTLFTLEVMLCLWNARAAAAALLTSAVAVAVARLGLGDEVQYHLAEAALDTPLLLWAVPAGAVFGVLAVWFKRSTERLPLWPRDSRRNVVAAVAAFGMIGVLAVFFPDILGNGKAGNQLAFGGLISGAGGLDLFAVKWLAVLLALAVGTYGGLITPSMMLGSMAAVTLASLWNVFLPAVPSDAAALLGAAAFLAVSMKMPVTALVFALEITRVSPAFWLPLTLCTASALWAARLAEREKAV